MLLYISMLKRCYMSFISLSSIRVYVFYLIMNVCTITCAFLFLLKVFNPFIWWSYLYVLNCSHFSNYILLVSRI